MMGKGVEDVKTREDTPRKPRMLPEGGRRVRGEGSPADPRDQSWAYMETHPYSIRHEILTGTQTDGRAFAPGRDHTCNNWTSEEEGNSPLRARNNTGPGAEIGKSDSSGPWNSQGVSGGCSHEGRATNHGARPCCG